MKGQTVLPGQGKRARERAGIEAGTRQRFTPVEVEAILLNCGGCHQLIGESMVTEHLLKCQPSGAFCGKCKDLIPAKDFLEHFKGCDGKPAAKPMLEKDIHGDKVIIRKGNVAIIASSEEQAAVLAALGQRKLR